MVMSVHEDCLVSVSTVNCLIYAQSHVWKSKDVQIVWLLSGLHYPLYNLLLLRKLVQYAPFRMRFKTRLLNPI